MRYVKSASFLFIANGPPRGRVISTRRYNRVMLYPPIFLFSILKVYLAS